MLSSVRRRLAAAPRCGVCRQHLHLTVLLLLGLIAAGCALEGQSPGPLAAGRTATIAIESIEGPPPAVSKRLVAELTQAAEARQLAVVSVEDQPIYRLHAYFTPYVENGKTSIAWVWDLYGPDERRAARLTGAEPSGPSSKDDWAAVDDHVVQRIARSGIDRVLMYLNGDDTSPRTPSVGTVPATVKADLAPRS